MNTIVTVILLGFIILVVAFFIAYRKQVVRKTAKDRAEKARSLKVKLDDLRTIAKKEMINLIELAHSINPELFDYLSLDDIIDYYNQSLPESIRSQVVVNENMCSTFEDFSSLASRGYPLSEGAYSKMYRFKNFKSLENMMWSPRNAIQNEKAFYSVYREKFFEWLRNAKSCDEIASLRSWNLNCDYQSSFEWLPACSKFMDLCRAEMSATNDIPTLWRLHENANRCRYYNVFIVQGEVVSKILSLTDNLDELKKLAESKDWSIDRVAKDYYFEAIQKALLKCKSREELRMFLNSHEIPSEVKPLSLRRMVELPEHSGIPTR